GGATGAVPHRTYPSVNAPWAPPGRYAVRLTVDGKTYTQPLMLALDPRVKTPAAGLAQLAAQSRRMYDGARETHAAYEQARALVAELERLQGSGVDAFRRDVEAVAPKPAPAGRGRGFGFFGRGPAGPPTLESVTTSQISAAMAMQAADATPTAGQLAACNAAAGDARAVMARWADIRTRGLARFNAARKAAGLPGVTLPGR
ncbi:MAG TPA: hypothetical protein VFT41_12570, partial [Gemmatimonadaceae bacterium]|nr:hypothetical protein [Gemmatimonadaceae bacterium]